MSKEKTKENWIHFTSFKVNEVNPKLAEFLEKNSNQEEDILMFEEQDATTLAANITLFLKKLSKNPHDQE